MVESFLSRLQSYHEIDEVLSGAYLGGRCAIPPPGFLLLTLPFSKKK